MLGKMNRTPPPLPLHPGMDRVNEGNAENNPEGGNQAPAARMQAQPLLVPGRTVDLSVANLIEVFRGDGTGPTVKDFFRLLESAAAMGRWTKEDMLRMLQLKVKSAAATFLSSLLELHGQEAEYELVKRAIIDRFTGKQTQHFHYANLTNAAQMRNESVEAFADRIRRLGTLTITPRGNPDEQKIVQEEAEQRMLHAFLHGLSGLAGQATRHKFPETWDEAVQYAVMVAADERSHLGREPKAVFSTLATCYNCQRPGHLARECRAPRRASACGRGGNSQGVGVPGGYKTERNESVRGRTGTYMPRQPSGRGFERGVGQNIRQDRGRRPLSEVECYRCHEKGHFASGCKKQMNNPENRHGSVE